MFVEAVFMMEVCQANQKAEDTTLCSLSKVTSGGSPPSGYLLS